MNPYDLVFNLRPANNEISAKEAKAIWNTIAESTLKGEDLAKFMKHLEMTNDVVGPDFCPARFGARFPHHRLELMRRNGLAASIACGGGDCSCLATVKASPHPTCWGDAARPKRCRGTALLALRPRGKGSEGAGYDALPKVSGNARFVRIPAVHRADLKG